MTCKYRWAFWAVPALLVLTGQTVCTQNIDESGPIVAEETVIEDPAADEEVPVQDLSADKEVAVDAIEALVEEALGDVIPEEKEAPEEPVEEAVEEPVEKIVEEPVEEVLEEPVEKIVEEMLEEVLEEPVEKEAPLAEAVEEEVPAAEVVEDDLDRLVEEAFEDAVAEGVPEPPASEVVEEVVEVDEAMDRLIEEAFEEAVAEGMPEPPLDPRAAEIAITEDAEVLRRKAYHKHAKESLRAAQKALWEKRYDHATTLFLEALKYLPRPETHPDRQLANKGLAESYYRRALYMERQGELEKALSEAKRAMDCRHPAGESLVVRIRHLIEHPPEPPPPPVPARWEEKEYEDKEAKIADLLKRGREYFMAAEYDKAQENYESVLSVDPQNTEAMRLMRKVAQKKYDIATMELEATRKDMMTEVRKAWNPRDYAMIEERVRPQIEPPLRRELEKTERMKILKKMESIIVPEIDFRQANIHDVVSFLQEASVEFDLSEVPQEKKGVNIILNLQPGARAPAAVTAEPPDLFAEPGAPEAGAEEVSLITFSARYISLMEALRIVTEVANLKYRIEGQVVMIVPFDAPAGALITRMYDVLPSVGEKISIMREELGARGEARGEFIAMEAGAGVEAADWKDFFREMGVEWPIGSSIKYVRSIGKLVVKNTSENLTEFEKILAVLNVVPNQIEIEARFVEVTQSDATSLGFEWLLTDDWELLQKKASAGVPLSSRERIIISANSAAGGFTKGSRFIRNLTEGGLPTTMADDILSIAGILTNPELTLVLHMLEQSGHADLLSAPKVTTQAGNEAMIKVVTEYIYPTDFTVTPITGTDAAGNSTIVGGVVEPSGFETREVGVILQVMPDVSPEGRMINLTMTPEVVTEPAWRDYGSVYTAPDGSQQQLTMEQPFFHSRSVSTSISIYNGATVVMGGMINEVRTDVDDKIPFLGDIPVIGRLFQSRYETSEKRNLLIFVTARLVDPAGRPLEESGVTADRLAETIE